MARNIEEIFGGVVVAPHQIPFTYTSTNGGETFLSLPFYPITGFVTINSGVQVPLDNFEIDGNTLNLGRELEPGDVVFCLFDKIMSPQDASNNAIRIYKFLSVGGETEFTPDFTAYGVQSLYIDGKYKTPGEDYNYFKTSGKVVLDTALPTGVWVVAEMNIKQNIPALAGNEGASNIGTLAGITVEKSLAANNLNTREHWRRQLADAGLTLVAGSFEEGSSVQNVADAVWHISEGKCYTWGGGFPKNVPAGSTPVSSGGVSNSAWIWVESSPGTFLSFDMFGINNTGTVDVTTEIKKVVALANFTKMPIIQRSGSYLISGSDQLVFYYSADFNGATFIPAAGYTGGIFITQPNQMVTYGAGSAIVNKINAAASTDLVANNSALASLAGDTTLDNCMVIFEFSDDAFNYLSGGSITTRKLGHITRISNNGKMEHAFKYGATQVTSIKAIPINTHRTYFHLPNIDYRYKPHPIMIQAFYVTNYTIEGGSTVNKPIEDVGARHIVSIQYFYDVHFKDAYEAYPSATFVDAAHSDGTASYFFNYGWGVRLLAENVSSNGYGWGSFGGGGYLADITFLRCNANTYDSHYPVIGYCRLVDCIMGDGGISPTGFGDLQIIRPRIILGRNSANPYKDLSYFPCIVQLRTTSGGWYDGDLLIQDATIEGYWDDYTSARGEGCFVLAAPDANTTLPASSPITPRAFRNIIIDGVTFKSEKASACFTSLVRSSRDGYVYFPNSIKARNIQYAPTGKLRIDLTNFAFKASNTNADTHPSVDTPDIFVSLENIDVEKMIFQRPAWGYRHNLRVQATGCKSTHYTRSPMQVYMNAKGIYTFTDCEVYNFVTSDGTTEATHPLLVHVKGGIVKSGTDLPIVTSENLYRHTFTCSDVTFIGDYSSTAVTASNTKLAQWANLLDCSFYDNSGNTVPSLMVYSGSVSNTTAAVELYIAKGNTLTAQVVASSTNYWDSFKLKYPSSGRFQRVITPGAVSSANTVAGTCSVTVSGTAYTGTTNTPLNLGYYWFAVGTRGAQAYISSIYSQYNLTALFVG